MRSARPVPCFLAAFLVMAAIDLARPAHAQAQPVFGSGNGSGGAGIGVGAAVFLGGMPGVEVAYDLPRFHVDGVIGFDSRDTNNLPGAPTRTEFTFGLRGWYHLHQGANSDFSLGVGFGFDHVGISNNGGSGTETFVEPGAEARVFLTPNFSLFGLAGFSLAFGDGVRVVPGVALASQVDAAFGFTYFFR